MSSHETVDEKREIISKWGLIPVLSLRLQIKWPCGWLSSLGFKCEIYYTTLSIHGINMQTHLSVSLCVVTS